MEELLPEDKHQAHGFTVREMANIQKRQSGEIAEPFKDLIGNRANLLKDKYFLEDGHALVLPEYEEGFFHVLQEARSFHPITGERQSKSFIQKYSPTSYEFMISNDGFRGMSVFIFHDPRFNKNNS